MVWPSQRAYVSGRFLDWSFSQVVSVLCQSPLAAVTPTRNVGTTTCNAHDVNSSTTASALWETTSLRRDMNATDTVNAVGSLVSMLPFLRYIMAFVFQLDVWCKQPCDPGPCKHNETTERFYFEPEIDTCKSMRYSGCGGNENNFDSHRNCMTTCQSEISNFFLWCLLSHASNVSL